MLIIDPLGKKSDDHSIRIKLHIASKGDENYDIQSNGSTIRR